MNNRGQIENILQKLQQYKKKYYLNQLFKGLLISLAYLLIAFLGLSLMEYQVQFNSGIRTFLFTIYSLSALYFLVKYIAIPAYHLINNGKNLSNKEAATQIGKYFPEISDKLLNFIQLNDLSGPENSLIQASILQKSKGLNVFNFSESIKIRKSNKKYFPYVVIPILLLALILMFAPYMITEGSYRIIKFNREFVAEAPFVFHVENEDLIAFTGEPYQLNIKLSGSEVPGEAFIIRDGIKQKLQKVGGNNFEFTFNNPQNNIKFYFEGAGFLSNTYTLKVFDRPVIQNMLIELKYPPYTGGKRERIENTGNLIVPEGTEAKWWIQSEATEKVVYENIKDNKNNIEFESISNNNYSLEKTFFNSEAYQLRLFNTNAEASKKNRYSIEVIKDKAPEIMLEAINDSSLFNQIALTGEIGDDYGFSRFRLNYSIINNGEVKSKNSINLPFKKDILNQKYFKLWNIDSLLLEENDVLQYYVEVADNDAINGAKSTRSTIKTFKLPNQEKIKEDIKKISQNTENQIDKSISSAKSINNKIQDLEEILKTKRNLNWQDKKLLEDLLNDNEELKKEMERIMKQSEENSRKREKFNQNSPELKEKAEQLQSLMEEMLQNENEELLEKLQKLMEEDKPSDDFRESVEDLKKREKNRLKEMERLMELFKRLEIQYDMNEVMSDLEKLSKKQEALSKETEEKAKDAEETKEAHSDDQDQEALKKQEELNDAFEESKKAIEDIKKRNQELKQPNPLKDTKEEENEVDQAQQESSEELKKGNQKGASEKQKKASEAMKKMSQSMAQMASGMEMEMMQENIDDLKDIVDNLLKLSFRQENLMKNFREVNASDPRFLSLSEEQLNMMNDSKIIEDSLTTLAERVFQLKSFITKEMTEMNESMQKSIDALKERDKNLAVGQQQFAMTSMNNLALMLDDVLEQMQMDMQSSQSNSSGSGNNQEPSAGEMQKALNQATQELSEGQKSGRQLSEGLAELAAEQARIKEKIKEMMRQQNQKKGEQEGSGEAGGLGDLVEEMEKIEEDLVNKRLDGKLKERQKKIVTRLLEADKAKEEQEEEDERKAETATDYERKRIPNAFDEYLKQKEKEIEQLQSVPPSFTPYYKNEINKYYKRLKSTEQTTL